MKITREQLKGIVREVMTEESEYQTFFKKALEKTGKSIPQMSDEEKKAFFNKIDAAWKGKGEKNERFGRGVEGPTFGSADESVNEGKFDKRSLLKMILKHDDAMITTNRGKEYIIYNPKSNNKQNADMWKGNNSVFAVDRDGEEHEIKYSDITNFKA